MKYEIDPDTFAISFYDGVEPQPFQFQPDYPNGDKFDSIEEAKAWAEASLAAFSDDCKVYAPNGKGLAGEPKPDPDARQKVLDRLGLTAAEVRLLLA
jgi:hypothetical protein